MDVLDWLTRWYGAQCDGHWEHGSGLSIGTLDNPGWSLKIDLTGTERDGRVLSRITHNYGHETDWWTCWTEDNVFHGAGGPNHLRSLLETFRNWATIEPDRGLDYNLDTLLSAMTPDSFPDNTYLDKEP